MKLSIPDLLVLVIYLAVVVGLGCWFSRRNRGTEAFMVAGRSLPGWVVGLSIFGTFVSSISFLANPGKSYAANWNPFVFGLSLPIAAWIATRWFVPFYRKEGHISAYHHFETRFGGWARTYAVVCYLLTQLARMGTIMYLVALAVEPLTGWNLYAIIVLTGVLVTLYTLMGGIEAVIWTDALQSVVLTLGLVVCCLLLASRMPEGPGQIFEIAQGNQVEEQHASTNNTTPEAAEKARQPAKNKFSLGSFSLSLSESTFWIVLIYGLFINLQNFGIDQSYVQRYITAESDQAAGRSVWLGALLYLPISALLFFVGTALFAFYTAQPELLPLDAEGNPIGGDKVFPHFIATELPVGVRGLLVAAIFAAAMSSVDSSLNCTATLYLEDVYKRYLNPASDEKSGIRILFTTTVLFGIAGTGIAVILVLIDSKSVLDNWWKLASVFSGGMLGLFLLGMISRHPTQKPDRAAMLGTVLGVLLIAWIALTQMKWWPESLSGLTSPFHTNLAIVFGTMTIVLVGFLLGSRLNSRPSTPDKS